MESRAMSPWASPLISWLIICSSFSCCVWFWLHPQPPGVAVAVLGPVAAVMTFRKTHSTHTWLTTLYIFASMGIELRDIRKDRSELATQQRDVRQAESDHSNSTAKGIRTSVTTSEVQFGATMKGIGTTIDAIRQTIDNTRPYASLQFRGLEPLPSFIPVSVNHQLSFNLAFTNTGTDVAKRMSYDARIYTGRLDDLPTQKHIIEDFNKRWREGRQSRLIRVTEMVPNEPSFLSFDSALTERDIKAIESRAETVYVMIRFSWADQTGKWLSDTCMGFQNPLNNLDIVHSCIGSRMRYKGR